MVKVSSISRTFLEGSFCRVHVCPHQVFLPGSFNGCCHRDYVSMFYSAPAGPGCGVVFRGAPSRNKWEPLMSCQERRHNSPVRSLKTPQCLLIRSQINSLKNGSIKTLCSLPWSWSCGQFPVEALSLEYPPATTASSIDTLRQLMPSSQTFWGKQV